VWDQRGGDGQGGAAAACLQLKREIIRLAVGASAAALNADGSGCGPLEGDARDSAKLTEAPRLAEFGGGGEELLNLAVVDLSDKLIFKLVIK